MRQLIYRNPLSVLWMMQEHGVKFEYRYNDDFIEIQQIRCAQDKFAYRNDIFAEILITGIQHLQTRNFWQNFEHGEAIVMPNSLPFYDPQDEDILIDAKQGVFLWKGRSQLYHEQYQRGERNTKIILRNDKHFHWPCEIREVGDAN